MMPICWNMPDTMGMFPLQKPAGVRPFRGQIVLVDPYPHSVLSSQMRAADGNIVWNFVVL